jgi:hypothetical protein
MQLCLEQEAIFTKPLANVIPVTVPLVPHPHLIYTS